ncbi:unnamed protein product, partial [Mesorhabditis belari]|uniref:Calcineurin-like phosphoesterase domain-containing protein n=1 Tax=Mesorhabditis belari TaxID=2138241 RepID=A0AAF3FKW4_9BILA
MHQPSLTEVGPPIVVCEDIHGQYSGLLRIFEKITFPPDANFIFLDDYVDRGQQNIEISFRSGTLKASSCFATVTSSRLLIVNLTRPEDSNNSSMASSFSGLIPTTGSRADRLWTRGVAYVF